MTDDCIEYPFICRKCGHTLRYDGMGKLTDGQWVTCSCGGFHEIGTDFAEDFCFGCAKPIWQGENGTFYPHEGRKYCLSCLKRKLKPWWWPF